MRLKPRPRSRSPRRSPIHSEDNLTSEQQDSGSESDSESEDAMAITSEAKAAKWRADKGVTDDMDFSFFFTSHGEAVMNAGTAVAQECSRTHHP